MCDLMCRFVIRTQSEMFNFITCGEILDIYEPLKVSETEKVYIETECFSVLAKDAYPYSCACINFIITEHCRK